MERFKALGVVEETLRRAQGRPVYPEPVEGRPSRSLSPTLSMKKRGKTLTQRCRFILSLSKEEREEFGSENVGYPQRGQDYLYPTTTAPSVPTTARVPPSRCSTSTSSYRKFDIATNFKRIPVARVYEGIK